MNLKLGKFTPSLTAQSLQMVPMEYNDDEECEVPENICALSVLAEAATEKIVKILVSHNPRLRPRYDRFDVSVAFRPCSEIEFDYDVFSRASTLPSCQIKQGSFASSCSMFTSEMLPTVGLHTDESNSGRDSPVASVHETRLQEVKKECIHSTCSSIRSFHMPQNKGLEVRRFAKDDGGSTVPRRRFLSRLLGCLGTSSSAD